MPAPHSFAVGVPLSLRSSNALSGIKRRFSLLSANNRQPCPLAGLLLFLPFIKPGHNRFQTLLLCARGRRENRHRPGGGIVPEHPVASPVAQHRAWTGAKKKASQEQKLFAVRTGLEPATSAVTGRHSNQLNYRTVFCWGCKYEVSEVADQKNP